MIISHSQLDTASEHSTSRSLVTQESLDLVRATRDGQQRVSLRLNQSSVSLSEQAQALSRRVQQGDPTLNGEFTRLNSKGWSLGMVRIPAASEATPVEVPELDPRTLMIRSIFEALTGKRFSIFRPEDLQGAATAVQPSADSAMTVEAGVEAGAEASTEANAAPEGPALFGMRYQYTELRQESEQTRFSAEGQVTTADGRTLSIDLELNMSRSFIERNELVIESGVRLKDPLVINFDGNATQLTDRKYSFDIDADGSDEQISFVSPGSGFLALDLDGDGSINDGSELFGALSGDGFADLALYDEDGNGFIDEGDAIYSSLRIWSRDGSGQDQLLALGDRDVGAIWLGSTATPFEIKNADNELQGVVRSSGLFLREDGSQGTVQQIDLVV